MTRFDRAVLKAVQAYEEKQILLSTSPGCAGLTDIQVFSAVHDALGHKGASGAEVQRRLWALGDDPYRYLYVAKYDERTTNSLPGGGKITKANITVVNIELTERGRFRLKPFYRWWAFAIWEKAKFSFNFTVGVSVTVAGVLFFEYLFRHVVIRFLEMLN